jgi:hypothetical protein
MRLRDKWKQKLLSMTLLLILFAYHLFHFCDTKSGLHLRNRLSWVNREVRLKDQTWQIKIPKIMRGSSGYLDSSSAALAGVGTVTRFLTGQYTSLAFSGGNDPYQKYYLRSDLEVQYQSAKDLVQKNTSVPLKGFIEHMEQHGVITIILPIPTKTSIERELLPKKLPARTLWANPPADGVEAPEEVYNTIVATSPQHVVSLYDVFKNKRAQQPDEFLYIPWDYHWSSFGISLAAREVLGHLKSRGVKVAEGDPQFAELAPLSHDDMLLRFLQLPQSYLQKNRQFGWREKRYVLSAEFPKQNGRLFLVGTSNSRRLSDTSYGLAALLGKATGREVLSQYVDGMRWDLTLAPLIRESDKPKPGDILVLEFPMESVHTAAAQPIVYP